MKSRLKSRSGFTLLELVIVIAIILLLAALLYNVVVAQMRKGRQVQSMNNLRQWGSALNSSLAANDYRMPYDGQGGGGITLNDDTAWFNSLPQYINEKPLKELANNPPKPGQKSVWINPAVPAKEGNQYVKPPSSFLFCYAMNYYLATGTDKMQKYSTVVRPSATVFMAEKGDDFANCNPEHIRAYFGDGDPKTGRDNSAHFLFCDGHVELRKRSDFDPNMMPITADNPSPTNNQTLNEHFTFVPYVGATSN